MARDKTLISLMNDYRVECGLSLNAAHNVQVRDAQVIILQNIQEWLWEDFAWPHLRVDRDKLVQAGQKLYNPPEDLDISRIDKIEVRYGGRWIPLTPGIEPSEHYITYDSDAGVRAWPAARWRIVEDEQIEIWPIPDFNGDADTLEGTLRFTGIRKLRPLVEDTDRADLDGRLIIMYAAAQKLASDGAKGAQLKLSQANTLYQKLKGSLVKRRNFKMFGIGEPKKVALRGPPTIYYRTNGN